MFSAVRQDSSRVCTMLDIEHLRDYLQSWRMALRCKFDRLQRVDPSSCFTRCSVTGRQRIAGAGGMPAGTSSMLKECIHDDVRIRWGAASSYAAEDEPIKSGAASSDACMRLKIDQFHKAMPLDTWLKTNHYIRRCLSMYAAEDGPITFGIASWYVAEEDQLHQALSLDTCTRGWPVASAWACETERQINIHIEPQRPICKFKVELTHKLKSWGRNQAINNGDSKQ